METNITLLGEDGREVSDGETGELCFENPYVRGYINLPEETARAFVKEIYVKLAQTMVTHNSQKDVTIREIKQKIADRKNIFLLYVIRQLRGQF